MNQRYQCSLKRTPYSASYPTSPPGLAENKRFPCLLNGARLFAGRNCSGSHIQSQRRPCAGMIGATRPIWVEAYPITGGDDHNPTRNEGNPPAASFPRPRIILFIEPLRPIFFIIFCICLNCFNRRLHLESVSQTEPRVSRTTDQIRISPLFGRHGVNNRFKLEKN